MPHTNHDISQRISTLCKCEGADNDLVALFLCTFLPTSLPTLNFELCLIKESIS